MDVLTPEQRSRNMRAIRGQKTNIEERLASALKANGIKFRRKNRDVFGKPDFTLRASKVAIFCDSEYFHGKDWEVNRNRIKTNTEFWQKKIEGNIARDRLVNETLLKDGWKVIRFWGEEINKKVDFCIDRIVNEAERKMLNYTEIRNKYQFRPDADHDNGLAYLTHYLHNFQDEAALMFREKAAEYFARNHESPDIYGHLFQSLLPLKWDVPFPTKKTTKFTFIDLFAGIGGIRLAYQNLGGKCVFTSEWDKFAKITYEANFGEVPFGDITKIDEDSIPDHDLLLAGFPCQPFSIAGVSKKNSLGRSHGFLDETQGTLFFDVARIIRKKRPKAFMLENVKNLVSHDKGRTFEVIYNALDQLDYSIHFRVIDGQHFVPQHRERIIIVGFDRKEFNGLENFKFPKLPDPIRKIAEILESQPDEKYTLTSKLWNYLQDYAEKHRQKGNGFGFGMTNLNGIARTLSARYYKDGSEILIPQKGKNPRRLTPRECARLMGYPDEFLIPVSDNQAYRQFGNSVVVPLIQAVAKEVVKVIVK